MLLTLEWVQLNTEHEFALLNAEACLSILPHQFKAWAGYQDGALYM
jgi:hypothetical protein